MSTNSSVSGDGESSSMAANHLKVAAIKRENIRQTLESIHSQSNSLLLLAFQWKDLEGYFDSVFGAIAKQMEEIELKLKQIEWKQKFLKKRSGEIVAKEKQLEESLKMADDRCREIDATYELIGRCYGVVREREERCDHELARVRRKVGRLRKYKHHLKRRFEKKDLKLESRELLVDNRAQELELREKKLGSIERKIWERLQEIELKEKRVSEIEKREKMVEEREQGLKMAHSDVKVKVKTEPLVDYDDDDDDDDGMLVDPSYADLRLNVTMDGRALQMFLNGRVKDHEILRDEVIVGLGLSSDPAKLVLDAIQGFYPEELGNGDVCVDLNIVRKSCVLLLEELIKMKPRIRTHMRERAMRVAMQWRGKMEINDADHYLEVVGFLQLVATYGLIDAFSKDELLLLFENCAHYDRAPELCCNLGFTNDVYDIIQNLILRYKPFEAIRLVYAFELVDTFPPVPILKHHLCSTFTEAENVYKKGESAVEEQIKCTSMKLDVLVSVIACIKKYGLESKYPVQPLEQLLEQLISELERQKRNCDSEDPACRALLDIQDEELCFALTPISSSVNEPASFTPLDSPIATQTCPKSTLALKSSPIHTEPVATDCGPNSTDASTSPTSSRSSLTMTKTKSTLDPEHTSQTGSPHLNTRPRSITSNKRPRLGSVVNANNSGFRMPALVNPQWPLYAHKPVYYWQATSPRGFYGDYTELPYCRYL